MKTCIICRLEKTEFSDEHVIPDSMKGYYHIYTVCKTCNSDLGTKVDSKLVNHKFIEFQRHLLGIKGKSGAIPNPFAGTQTLRDDPEQKVIVTFDEKGQLTPRLLPKIPIINSGEKIENLTFTLDAKDIHLKDKIIDKILKRNGIDKSRLNYLGQKEHLSIFLFGLGIFCLGSAIFCLGLAIILFDLGIIRFGLAIIRFGYFAFQNPYFAFQTLQLPFQTQNSKLGTRNSKLRTVCT